MVCCSAVMHFLARAGGDEILEARSWDSGRVAGGSLVFDVAGGELELDWR